MRTIALVAVALLIVPVPLLAALRLFLALLTGVLLVAGVLLLLLLVVHSAFLSESPLQRVRHADRGEGITGAPRNARRFESWIPLTCVPIRRRQSRRQAHDQKAGVVPPLNRAMSAIAIAART